MGKTTKTLKEWAIKGIGAGAGIAVAIIVVNAATKALNIGASFNPHFPEFYTGGSIPNSSANPVFFFTNRGPSGIPGRGSVKFYTNA